MVTCWLFFNPHDGLKTEVNAVLWRQQTDEALFKFRVIEQVEPEFAKRLTNEDYYEEPKDGEKVPCTIDEINKK